MAEEKVDDVIDFEEGVEEEENNQEMEVDASDFKGGNYIKTPEVGETISFEVEKVIKRKNTHGKNKETGVAFRIGLKKKNGTYLRYDIHTIDGASYTVKSWGVFFDIFGNEGVLTKYAKDHNGKYKGAKMTITRNIDGRHGQTKIADLMKILDKNEEETKAYQKEVKAAIKNGTVYTVELVDTLETPKEE